MIGVSYRSLSMFGLIFPHGSTKCHTIINVLPNPGLNGLRISDFAGLKFWGGGGGGELGETLYRSL